MPTPNNPQSNQGQGPFQVLSAVTTGTGTVDFGEPLSTIMWQIVASAGVSAGAVTMELSVDGVTWFTPPSTTFTNYSAATLANPYVLVASTAALFDGGNSPFAIRYARAVVSTTVVGGTVSVIISGY